jgi:hypothetical protein
MDSSGMCAARGSPVPGKKACCSIFTPALFFEQIVTHPYSFTSVEHAGWKK